MPLTANESSSLTYQHVTAVVHTRMVHRPSGGQSSPAAASAAPLAIADGAACSLEAFGADELEPNMDAGGVGAGPAGYGTVSAVSLSSAEDRHTAASTTLVSVTGNRATLVIHMLIATIDYKVEKVLT